MLSERHHARQCAAHPLGVGRNGPGLSRRDMLLRAARWLESCGCKVPRDAAGLPDLPLEISPAFALDVGDLRERLVAPPELKPGQALVLT
jgi:hypothetical protein